ARLRDSGVGTFLELGPDGTLTGQTRRCLDGDPAAYASALRADRAEADTLLRAVATVHVHGGRVDWSTLIPARTAGPIDLPTYPFQRRRYWLDSAPAPAPAADDGETQFWHAVEHQDAAAVASTLDLDPDALAAVLPALSAWRGGRRERARLDSWRYRVTWQPLTDRPTLPTGGTWLLLTADGAVPDDLAATFPGHLRGVRFDADLSSFTDITGVVCLPTGPDDVLPLLRAELPAPLWVCTRGAVSVNGADRLTDPSGALLWGLGRVAALELPQRWGGLIDLPAELDARAASRLLSVLTDEAGEDQVAVRDSGVLARRLRRAPLGS
ncbi:polyketide synthase, partial [Streptomyces sp. ACA25]|nr:polyketide synthase [Streptomyces sp. ACA25]